jgi:hypothetical protein
MILKALRDRSPALSGSFRFVLRFVLGTFVDSKSLLRFVFAFRAYPPGGEPATILVDLRFTTRPLHQIPKVVAVGSPGSASVKGNS